MSHGYCETTSYLRHEDVPEAAARLAALLEAEGMRRIQRPPQPLCSTRALETNLWSVAMYPGSAGWCLVRTAPSDLLGERALGSGRSRLAQLSADLGKDAFQVNDADGGPWGEVVLETEATGDERASGWWSQDGSYDEDESGRAPSYYGLRLDASEQLRLGRAELQALFEQSRDREKCSHLGDSDFEIFCHYLSDRLGGANGFKPFYRALFRGPPIPRCNGILMFFEWPAGDRPWPQRSEEDRIKAELFREPRFFYADGTPVQLGDAVLLGDACMPALVSAFGAEIPGSENRLSSYAERQKGMGNLQPSHVLVDDGADEAPPAVRIETVAAQLRLVERASIDFERAGIRCLIQSAFGGDTITQSALGGHYLSGRYLVQDDAQAVRWLERAASRGHAGAQYRLGRLCLEGRGLERSPEQALRWWRKAANGGSPEARFALAVRYESGVGLPQDFAQAATLYRKLADQGYRRAQCNLGYLYERGLGVERDYTLAQRQYLAAADELDKTPGRIRSGLPEAQYRMGMLWLQGLGVKAADREQAYHWLKNAANGGYDGARLALARMYELGDGVAQNANHAQDWRDAEGKKPQPGWDELLPDGPASPVIGIVAL